MENQINYFSNPDGYIEERTDQLINAEETYERYSHFPNYVERSLAKIELEQAKLYILANDILQNKATYDDLLWAILGLDFDLEAEILMQKYGVGLDRY